MGAMTGTHLLGQVEKHRILQGIVGCRSDKENHESQTVKRLHI